MTVMVITAQRSTVCPTCRNFIKAGEKVSWARGMAAAHVNCPSLATTADADDRAYDAWLQHLAEQHAAFVASVRRFDEDDRSYNAWIDFSDGVERLAAKLEAATMVPYLSGDTGLRFEEEEIVTREWKCLGCGLVWTRRHQARDCGSRDHAASYVDRYAHQVQTASGPKVEYDTYTRSAVRRESLVAKPTPIVTLGQREKAQESVDAWMARKGFGR